MYSNILKENTVFLIQKSQVFLNSGNPCISGFRNTKFVQTKSEKAGFLQKKTGISRFVKLIFAGEKLRFLQGKKPGFSLFAVF